VTTRGESGAIPLAKLAEVDSGLHHLREQADIDRRATAARLVEERRHRERMEAAIADTASQLGRVTDLTNRLDVSTHAHAETLGQILIEQAKARGALWVIGALVAAVPVGVEVVKHLAAR
jgi:hypothetical protein